MEQLRLNPTAPVELTETLEEALFAFRTELLNTEAGFYALFSGFELEEVVLLSVQRAIMSMDGRTVGTDWYGMWYGFLVRNFIWYGT